MNDTTTDRAKAHAAAKEAAEAASRAAAKAAQRAASYAKQAKSEAARAEAAQAVLAQYSGEPIAVRRTAGEALKAAFKELRRDGYRCTMGEQTSVKESEFYLWSTNEQARSFREDCYHTPYYLYHGSDAHHHDSPEYLTKLAHAVAVLEKHGLPVRSPDSIYKAIAIKADCDTTVFAVLPTV
jgi:hypothetical protein